MSRNIRFVQSSGLGIATRRHLHLVHYAHREHREHVLFSRKIPDSESGIRNSIIRASRSSSLCKSSVGLNFDLMVKHIFCLLL